ncbi:MAG: response regulator [Acidobacteria bacterium]|nr:response regulator [Acidobacteriota bacterium]
MIKTLGSLIRRAPGIAGSTLTGDGGVVLILNPGELVGESQAARPVAGPTKFQPSRSPRTAEANRALQVMVVDDSVSVRRVLESLLQSAGWRAVPARDGVEALDLLRGGARPDVLMVDIEMPRMDGYELTAALRAHPQFQQLPILMLTSRAGEKHRARALSLGVSDYLVKPYQEETLLAVIRRLAREYRQREAG